MGTPQNRGGRPQTPVIARFPTKTRTLFRVPALAPARGDVTASRLAGVVPPSIAVAGFEADPRGHRVVARGARGQVLFAFGRRGDGPAQFDTPLHVVRIAPVFGGESGGRWCGAPWLAVADYGNHRVQCFEADGVHVGTIDLSPDERPGYLVWHAPILDVYTVEGRRVSVHVAAALLAARHTGPPESLWKATFATSARRPC